MAKKIEWLTKEYIRQQGKKSKRAAIECSRDHWKQLWQATEKQLREAYKKNVVGIKGGYCSLCIRYYDYEAWKCSHNCPLVCESGSLWDVADDLFPKRHFSKWKKAAKALYEKLDELASKYQK